MHWNHHRDAPLDVTAKLSSRRTTGVPAHIGDSIERWELPTDEFCNAAPHKRYVSPPNSLGSASSDLATESATTR